MSPSLSHGRLQELVQRPVTITRRKDGHVPGGVNHGKESQRLGQRFPQVGRKHRSPKAAAVTVIVIVLFAAVVVAVVFGKHGLLRALAAALRGPNLRSVGFVVVVVVIVPVVRHADRRRISSFRDVS